MLYGGLVGLQPFLDESRQVVGVGSLVHPFGQDDSQLVKLVNHWWDNEPDNSAHDGYCSTHCQKNGKGTHLDMEFILDELHDGVEQVSEKPCYKER